MHAIVTKPPPTLKFVSMPLFCGMSEVGRMGQKLHPEVAYCSCTILMYIELGSQAQTKF